MAPDTLLRISEATRARISMLAEKLAASSDQEVIERALDKLERELFWDGFEEEVRTYLARSPHEEEEQAVFGHTSADGLTQSGDE